MAFNRRKTRAENDRSGILRRHERWTGQDSDSDPTQLGEGKVQLLQNAIAYGKYVEERPGMWIHSGITELITAAAHYGRHFHKASKRWIFHIDGALYYSNAAVAALTEIKDYATVPNSFGVNASTNGHTIFQDFQDGVLLTAQNSTYSGLIYVNLSATTPKFFKLTATCPIIGWEPGADDVAATLYRYRYLFTFSRIEDGSSHTTPRSQGGVVIHESGTVTQISSAGRDYHEIGKELPIGSVGSVSSPVIDVGELTTNRTPDLYALESSPHWNFLSIYRTMDIGSDYGTNSLTGEVNDPEQYIWIKDLPLSSTTFITDVTTDNELRARIATSESSSRFLLKTRGFVHMGVEVPYDGERVQSVVEKFASSPNFLFAVRNANKRHVDYCQLAEPRFAGYHNPLQNKKFAENVEEIKVYKNSVTFCHSTGMSGADLNAFKDVGDQFSIFELMSFYPLEPSIGIVDYSSIADIDNGHFMAHCSDGSIRRWDGTNFGTNLAEKSVSKIVKTMVPIGSVGAYENGAYIIWYRVDTSASVNAQALRLSLEEQAGMGWSYYALGNHGKTNKFHGANAMIDDNGYRKLIAGYAQLCWIETYDGPTGSGLYRAVKDGAAVATPNTGSTITSRVKLPDYTGDLESFESIHQLSYIGLYARRVYSASNPNYSQDANGFASGFSQDIIGYADGVEVDETINLPARSDLEFYTPPRGSRIGVEVVLNAGGWRISRTSTRLRNIDSKKQEGIADSDDADYHSQLEGDLVLHLSRGDYLDMERTLARRYESLVDGFTAVYGPDGMPGSAMLFGATAGSRLSLAASYFSPVSFTSGFTFTFWVKSPPFGSVISSAGPGGAALDFNISFVSATVLSTPFGNFPITDVSDGEWHCFTLSRASILFAASYRVFLEQNGDENGTTYDSLLVLGLFSGVTYIGSAGMTLFDVRLTSTDVDDAAKDHYINDVLNNAGKKVLPY